MVIQFKLSNYRSIYHPQTLNFRATTLISEDKEVDNKNIADVGSHRILKSVGIYGANASGKSNIIKGLQFFKNMVSHSLTAEDLSKGEINPFKQSTEKVNNYGYFEIVLLIETKKYRYGFTLSKNANIDSEWLYGPAEKNETYYFTRKNDVLTVNPLWFQEGDDLPKEKLRSDALFLSFCASYDGNVSTSIRNFIHGKITIDPFSNSSRVRSPLGLNANRSTDNLIESGKKDVILRWMKEVGLLFSDVKLDKLEISGRHYGNFVTFSKYIYNSNGEIEGNIPMNLNEDESQGTKKFYSYIGRLHQKFEEGGLFVSDEIDSNFHPTLLRKLISYFNNSTVNSANAQILFTSHDTNLMLPELMRRDQFYFSEKSLIDETILYSLADLKGIRNNADFARQYLAGLYGALPVLGNYLEEESAN